jgi:hypothetical protein
MSMIIDTLGSTVAKFMYRNLGIIFVMEIAKIFLTYLVAGLPGGEVLTIIIS